MTQRPDTSPVTSIAPMNGREDDIQVTFQGEALAVLRDLQQRLGVQDEKEVVLRAVQLLLSAVDKEVLLRQGNRTEVIRLWE